ncbi:MAG: DUF4476 domain-containing protein [Bacteroidia bacterium]|nr:DUF4476 domain-containing protein [Bacteroidia bacterium]
MRLIAVLLSLLWIQAQTLRGDLVIFSETGEPFRLYLDGEWIGDAPTTRAEVHDLTEGFHRATIQIYPAEGKVVQIRRNLTVEGGFVEYYAIRKRKNQYVVSLSNRAPRDNVEPPSPPQNPPPTAGSSTGGGGQNTTIVFNPTIQVQTGGGTQIVQQGGQGPAAPGTAQPPANLSPVGYAGPCNCNPPTGKESVLSLLSTLRQEPFEQTRAEMARAFFQRSCVLAADVREILRTFQFEDTKLDLAKFAYDYTHDLANYLTVSEVLLFSSQKEELARYIQGRAPKMHCYAQAAGLPPQPPAPPRPPRCTPCMNAASFSKALNTLRSQGSDLTRLEIARQVVTTNCPTSEQIQQLCAALSAEPHRLELAKLAYARACDPENYFVVHSALSSATSREELSQYIQSVGGR